MILRTPASLIAICLTVLCLGCLVISVDLDLDRRVVNDLLKLQLHVSQFLHQPPSQSNLVPMIDLVLKVVSNDSQAGVINRFKHLLRTRSESIVSQEFWETTFAEFDACQLCNPVHTASRYDDITALDMLLCEDTFGMGFDPDVLDRFGWTALHNAAWMDKPHVVSALMAKGADPFLVTVEGLSILHVAVMRGADFVLRSILDNVKLRFGEESVCALINLDYKHMHGDNKRLSALGLAKAKPEKSFIAKAIQDYSISCGCNKVFRDDKSPIKQLNIEDIKEVSTRPILCFGMETIYLALDEGKKNYKIEVREASTLTTEEFISSFYVLQRPVLITGNLTRDMGAWLHMSSIKSFRRRYGDLELRIGLIPYPSIYDRGSDFKMTIRSFLRTNFNISNPSEYKNISTDWYEGNEKIMFDDFVEPKYMKLFDEDFAAPKLFRDICGLRNGEENSDYIHYLPMNRQFSFGPKGSGTPLHAHSPAWNVVFRGVKKWIIFPPGQLRTNLTFDNTDVSYDKFQLHDRWSLNTKLTQNDGILALQKGKAYEVLQFPGDVLYIPPNWGHATINICGVMAVAQEFKCSGDVTMNSNLRFISQYPIFKNKLVRKQGMM